MSATATKHALITGSSSGIGAAITQKLLAEGWQVTGLSRKPGDYSHPNFTHRAVDIMDTPALTAILDEIAQVDAVIHAAGIMKAAPLGQLSLEDGETLWRLHINAAQVLADRLVDKLPQGGRIVLLGSRVQRFSRTQPVRHDKIRDDRHGKKLGSRTGSTRHYSKHRRAGRNRNSDADHAGSPKLSAEAAANWALHPATGSGRSGGLPAFSVCRGHYRPAVGDVRRRIAVTLSFLPRLQANFLKHRLA